MMYSREVELSILYEISSIPARLSSLQLIFDLALDKAARVLGAEVAVIYLVDSENTHLRAQAARGLRLAKVSELLPLTDGEIDLSQQTWTWSLAQSRSLTCDPLRGAYPVQAALGLPIRSGSEMLGWLYAARLAARPFDEVEVSLFTVLASRIATALENAQLHAAEKARAAELERAYKELKTNQENLLITEKMAVLGRLTAGIAHEMNTPLATVRASLAELDKLTHEYEISLGDSGVTLEDYREITREMRQALQLAQKAAELSASFVRSIKSQIRELTPQERLQFDAVQAIRDSLLLLNHELRRGKCVANFETEAEPVQLFGSPGRLAQVVTNLVVNAIDASARNGGGRITLRLEISAAIITLRVSDQGSGISPEILPKIFNPMFTTKPFGQGTGLGLTIVHDIVTGDFGGSIEVASQPGQGTTFILRFPQPA